jgi:D-serine deaminase-like pyridoxal phosphate-dependent protein
MLQNMELAHIPTPAAVVDLDRLEANAERLAAKARRLGVRLRPHIKTHKSVAAARIQTRGQFGGITVSTLAEATAFAEAGFADITYAIPVPTTRLHECAELTRRLRSFHLLLDQRETLAALENYARGHQTRFSAYLKVDCGLHRAGVDPSSDAAVELAAAIDASPAVDFRGILTHAGQAYRARSRDEAAGVAAAERDVMIRFAHRLRTHGVDVHEVSIGSTPTMVAVDHLDGITEIRPGNYLFFDVFQSAVGSCDLDEVAFSVLATVIGVYQKRRQMVVDAGALALSKDPGPVHVDPDCGFGVVTTVGQQRPVAGLTLVSLSQEHGVIEAEGELDPEWRPGTRFRVLPNHSCLSAACFDRCHVVRGTEIVDEWETVRGW